MIGLDLDGTLLTDGKELTGRTMEVLKRAVEQGVVVLVATGRPLSGVPIELREFPGMRYSLTANGARIVDTEKEQVLFESLLPIEVAHKVLDIYEGYDTIQEVYFDGIGYADAKKLRVVNEYLEHPSMAKYVADTRIPVDSVRAKLYAENRPLDKVQAIFRRIADKEMALQELEGIAGIAVTGAISNNIEVNNIGVNKGSGLLRLGKMMGIRREEIMACGDGLNDLDMMREVGFAVAMKNGHEKVKALADYITESNEEEGVANAIEKFVLM